MSNKSIYTALRAAGMTAEGACGLMGNMMAESNMRSNIAQRGMTSLSDAEYTRRADAGTLDFVHDAVGYGLCQWTYFSRKQNLLAFARSSFSSSTLLFIKSFRYFKGLNFSFCQPISKISGLLAS